MVEFVIHSRGTGLAKVIASGLYSEKFFSELFDFTPEQLLTEEQRRRLDNLLFRMPRLHGRRTKKQRLEAEELLEIIASVTEGELDAEARELLLKRIAGATIRPPHRPKKTRKFGYDFDVTVQAKWIKQSVELCIQEGIPLNVPRWGDVEDDPSWSTLPTAERASRIAWKVLHERGFEPPSPATLRNRISEIPDLRHLIVKAREEIQG